MGHLSISPWASSAVPKRWWVDKGDFFRLTPLRQTVIKGLEPKPLSLKILNDGPESATVLFL